MMGDAAGMIGTGIGLSILGLGAGSLIKTMGSAANSINKATPKKSTKRKSAKKKRK